VPTLIQYWCPMRVTVMWGLTQPSGPIGVFKYWTNLGHTALLAVSLA